MGSAASHSAKGPSHLPRAGTTGGRGGLSPPGDQPMDGENGQGSWAALPPELLWEVVSRVERGQTAWPSERHLLACAAVCRSWRQACWEIAGALQETHLALPVLLKQPGPRVGHIQCYIKRNKVTSTYQLFVGVSENGKFLLAARKIRYPTCVQYIISTDADDISPKSLSYMGKLRSNFLGNKFSLQGSQPTHSEAMATSGHSSPQFDGRKSSPKMPSGKYGIAQVTYEPNFLVRLPRRISCTMHSINPAAVEPTGLEHPLSRLLLPRPLDCVVNGGGSEPIDATGFPGSPVPTESTGSRLILKNKKPKWNEKLHHWCLDFHGRVSVASVKNFQLLTACGGPVDVSSISAGTSPCCGSSEHDGTIILQFGKIGDDLFTMDYQYPLSAFQAFGICLTTFGTKIVCE